MHTDKIIIFTDGSSKGNPGPGGWGVIVVSEKEVKELGGHEEHTTNNKMELIATIEALKYVLEKNKNVPVTLFTDSKYVALGATTWLSGWKRNGWKTANKKEVLNRDLWEKISDLISKVNVSFEVLKGHNGIAGNERCDEIATSFADKIPVQLFSGPRSNYKVGISVSS